MSGSSLYGELRLFDPPITYDGEAYSAGILWKNHQRNLSYSSSNAPAIVTGIIQEVIDLGDGRKKLIIRREAVLSSRTVVNGPGDSYEEQWASHVGGNFCACAEPARVFSWLSTEAKRGGNFAGRCMVGDVLWVSVGGVELGFFILEAVAFGYSSGVVNYNGDSNLPLSAYIRNECNNVVIEDAEEAEVVFDDAGVAAFPFEDTGLARGNTGTVTFGAGVRHSFSVDPEGDDYYPPDAEFPNDGEFYYHFETTSRAFHFPTQAFFSAGIDWLNAIYYLRGLPSYDINNADEAVVLESDGVYDGHGGTADELLLASMGVQTAGTADYTFDEVFTVEGGSGAMEWRHSQGIGPINTARMVALRFADGVITSTGVIARTIDGAAAGTRATPAASYVGAFQVRIRRTVQVIGTEVARIAISHRQDSGDPWSTEVEVDFDNTDSLLVFGGFLSLASSGDIVRGKGFTSEAIRLQLLGDATGTMSIRRSKVWQDGENHPYRDGETVSLKWFQQTTLPRDVSANAIDSVTNTTADVEMNDIIGAGAHRRDYYAIDTGAAPDKITLYSESAGDLVLLVQEPDPGDPVAPGRPPRGVNGQTNFMDEEDPDNVSKNHAARNDYVIISDETNSFPPAGIEGTARRTAVLAMDNHDLVIASGIQDPATSASVIDPANYLSVPGCNATFFKKAFVDTLDANQLHTIGIVGDRLEQTGQVTSRGINDYVASMQILDQAWISSGSVLGGNFQLWGRTIIPCTINPTGYSCGPGGYYATGMNWGLLVKTFDDDEGNDWWAWVASKTDFAGGDYGANDETNLSFGWTSTARGVPAWRHDDYDPQQCNGTGIFLDTTADVASPRNYFVWVSPMAHPGGDIGFGGEYWFGSGRANAVRGNPSWSIFFKVGGIQIGIPEFTSRIRQGATIVAAWIPMRFTGLQHRHTRVVYRSPSANLGITGLYEVYEHGVLALQETATPEGVWTTVVQEEAEVIKTGGVFSASLMGKRLNEETTLAVGGNPTDGFEFVPSYEMPAHEYVSLGAGLTTTTDDDDSGMVLVDVTNIVQALVSGGLNHAATEFFLYPSIGIPAPNADANTLGSFLTSMEPTMVGPSWTPDSTTPGYLGQPSISWELTTRSVGYQSWQIGGGFLVRWRMPNGTIEDDVLHLVMPETLY